MASEARARLFDLYPADADALRRIRERLELSSDALAIRVALRDLARRLSDPQMPADALQIIPPEGDSRE
jgi:hypothetical protein